MYVSDRDKFTYYQIDRFLELLYQGRLSSLALESSQRKTFRIPREGKGKPHNYSFQEMNLQIIKNLWGTMIA